MRFEGGSHEDEDCGRGEEDSRVGRNDHHRLLDQRSRLKADVKSLGEERTLLLADVSRVDAQLGALRQQTRALESRGALAGEEIAAFATVESMRGGAGSGSNVGASSSQKAAERVIELRVLIKELRNGIAAREAELQQARELRSTLDGRLASCRAELAALPRQHTVTADEGRIALLALIDEKAALQQRALDRVTEAAQARRAAENERSELEARLDSAVEEAGDLQADAYAWERKCVAEQAVLDELGAQASTLTSALSGYCDGTDITRHNKALRAEFDRFAQRGGVAEGTRLDAADVVPALLALVDGDAEQLQAAADEQRAETELQQGGGDGSVGFPEFCVLFSRVLGLSEKPEG